MNETIKEYVCFVIEHFSRKFDIRKLKNIKTLWEIRHYISNYFDMIGKGSAREVYLMSPKYVLKLAIGKKGILQNKIEFEVSQDSSIQHIIARVHQHGQNFQWIISDLVRHATENELKNAFGFEWSFREFIELVDGFANHITNEVLNEYFPNTPPMIVKSISALLKKGILVGDLKFFDHWGKTSDGRYVVLDYGFTQDVQDFLKNS